MAGTMVRLLALALEAAKIATEAASSEARAAPKGGAADVEILVAPISIPIATSIAGMPFTARFGCFMLSGGPGEAERTSKTFAMTPGDFDAIRRSRPGMIAENAERRRVLEAFLAELRAEGLEEAGKGETWYSHRFHRPAG